MHHLIRLAGRYSSLPALTLVLLFAASACRPSVDPATLEALERTRAALDERANALDERSRSIEARIAEIEKKAIESENAELKKEVERLKDESKTLRGEADRALRESEKLARQIEAEKAKLPGPQPDRMRDQRDYSMFYRELAPFGVWFDVAGYGYCFQPRVARDPSWRPYLDGRWVWSDRGWAWSSNEPFGWIVYHYGRWLLTVGHGWIWVPDVEWAPAWVAWRRGDEYIGWAPLPPERGILPTFIGADADIRYRLGPPHYTFIEINFFAAPTYVRYCRPVVYNTTIIHQTINITNIIYIGEKKKRKCYVKGGPDRHEIERRCGRPIPVARIAQLEEGQAPPENWAETDHESRKILHAAVLPERTSEEAKPENVEARIEPQPVVAEAVDVQPSPGQPDQEQPPLSAPDLASSAGEATSESNERHGRNDSETDQVVISNEDQRRDGQNVAAPTVADRPEASPSTTDPADTPGKDDGESRDSAGTPVEAVIRSVDESIQHSEEQARNQQAEAEAQAAEAAERERQAALEDEREQEALAAERQRQQEELARQEEAARREEQRRAEEEARRREQMERMRQQEEEERERRQQEEFARQRQLEEMERRRAEEEARRQEQMEQMRRRQEEYERRQQEEYERRQQEEFARQQREEEEYRRAQAEMERRQMEEQERWAAEQRRAAEEAAREQARAQREAELEAAREAERQRRQAEVIVQPYGEEPGE